MLNSIKLSNYIKKNYRFIKLIYFNNNYIFYQFLSKIISLYFLKIYKKNKVINKKSIIILILINSF